MKKKKRLLPIVMASLMAMSINVGPLKAADAPLITNPSFEHEIDKNEVQLYKAVRTDEKAFDGKYSIKVGNPKPENPSEVPIWRYNYGKGSVNVIFHNVEPNTTYKITTHYWNESGVKMSTGVLDIEGKHTTSPWQLASNIQTNQKVSTEWQTNEHTITTGPRTNEIYGFAYMEWTGNDLGSGVFYIDDFKIEKVENKTVEEKASINYDADFSEFPETVPAVQNFEKNGHEIYKLNTAKQVFSTDEFSKAKTQYLADSMVKKGLIKDYTIKTVTDASQGEGIVLVKQPITFELPAAVTTSKIDAYQIDIDQDKTVIHSDYIQGIQNGAMTILQAFAQRKSLPAGSVQDYSDQVVRGLQVDSGRRYYSIQWLKDQIEQMAYYKQNILQLRLKDNEGIRYDSKIAADFVDRKGGFWTQEEVDELVSYAAKFNIEVIPEIDFPGHAEQEANFHSGWCIPGSTKALDFSKQEVREYMISVYKEAADFFHAKTIHIGGDEYFQSGYTTAGKTVLQEWARQVTGNEAATDHDAIKLFFNEAGDELIKQNLKVLVWNDNIFDLGGIVPLDSRLIVDFWAGGMYGSIKASTTANAGYTIMSSSSSNYHDLWPQQGQSKLDRPLPKRTYEEFTRYHYSKSSYHYGNDEVLTENLDKSLGQVFPIWDDAHGYVPEYILTRTLFPRYAGFALKTWGAEYQKEMDYESFERLMYTLGSPRDDLFTQSKINYNKTDLDLVINKIETALADKTTTNTAVQENIDNLNAMISDVKANPANYQKDSFYTDIINDLIYNYENVEYVVVKKNLLNIAIEEALKVTEAELNTIVPAVVTEFKAALAEAQQINGTSLATQEEVNASFDRLSDVMQKLSFKKGDKTDLENLIKKIAKLNAEDYLTSTWNAMLPVLDEAKVVVNNQNALEPEVQEAHDKLVRAFLQLRLKPNKDALNELINKAESLNSAEYTSESWAALANILIDVKAVAANEVATVTEIETAYDNLQNAINNLVKVTPAEPTTPNTPDANKKDDVKQGNVKTGDNTNIALYTSLFIMGALVLPLVLKKKRHN